MKQAKKIFICTPSISITIKLFFYFYIIENIMNPISGKCSIIISFIALFCIPLNDRYLKYLCIGKYIILCFCAFLKYFITSFSCFFRLLFSILFEYSSHISTPARYVSVIAWCLYFKYDL